MQKVTEYITSRQNSLLSLVTGLSERKIRRREGLFRFDGKKLFCEALQSGVELTAVLFRESNLDEISQMACDLVLPVGCRAVILPDELFDRISEEKAPDGVICVAKSLDKIHKIATIDKSPLDVSDFPSGKTLLLESVRDPGNLGTVIRSAKAFGVQNLVLSADCADLYNPRTIRAAMGALFTQRVFVVQDFVGAVRALSARGRVYAAALCDTSVRLGQTEFGENDAVAVGNEGHGLSREAMQACTDSIYIPMAPGVESLNAGIAASVILWEFYRGK